MRESNMQPFQNYLNEYKKQLKKGAVKEAYKGLMQYFSNLRLHLKSKYPDYFLSGSIHFGQMDYTYFYFFPKTLKQQKLKIVIIFIHDTFTIQVMLAGYNKNAQAKYWKLFKENNWTKYPLTPTLKGVEYITEFTITDNPDFSNLNALTNQIETGTLTFIKDIENFLIKQK
jgi:hypothetical protein